jgi:uncharacterized protein YutE (UPF0331/DUF86 family)
MNEQIKKIALQSQLVYETTDGKIYNSWEDYVDLTEYVEKFAELIVQKCADIGNKAWKEDGEYTYIGDKIKAHFGVEQ